MKQTIAAIMLIAFAACYDRESSDSTTRTGGDTTMNKSDSLLNNPGTGYGNETTDTLGVSTLGSGTDTSGSLKKKNP